MARRIFPPDVATQDYWVHDLDPFLVRFTENFGIRYYGLSYLLGFVIAYLLLGYYYRKGRSPLDADQQSNAFFAIIIGVMAGGRIGYFLFYEPRVLVTNPLTLFRVWEGGMASHGAFIGVTLAVFWVSWRQKIAVLRFSDLLVTVAAPGIFFGRIANFINGELWGRVTTVPWAVRFPQAAPGRALEEIPPRHPSQLYEAALEGLVLFLYIQIRFWNSKAQLRTGQLTGEFLVGYAIARIISEMFREPDADPILGMTRGAFYSLFVAAAGIGFILYARRQDIVRKPA
jgi:phosphatidylglycerol---prolipoprotein diacylglyceryl transferase